MVIKVSRSQTQIIAIQKVDKTMLKEIYLLTDQKFDNVKKESTNQHGTG